MAEIYKVSRPTVRKAVQILVGEGYLEKRKKRGTIVCDPTIRQEFAQVIQTFDQEVKEKGLIPSTKVLTFKKEKAEEEVCQKLNLSETEEVYKLVRLRYIDDQPNVLVTTYVPCRLFEHLSDIDFEKESLYQTFHKEGRDITSIKRKLDVILADETCADLLDIKNGDPLFYFHSTGYDERIQPLNILLRNTGVIETVLCLNFRTLCIILNTFIYKYQFFLYDKQQ